MKNLFLLTLVALGLTACADTRNHINDDETTWEKVRYQDDPKNMRENRHNNENSHSEM